jgi:Cys-rich protein (TIGR01571 family)
LTRVGFDFLGRPSLDNSINGPRTLMTILSFWVFMNLALFAAYNVKWSRGMELSAADLGAIAVVNVAYTLFLIYLTSATRGSLREKYYIRESRFHDLEDCCCATFCLPCSVCQMARHTADYDGMEGVCCNDSGLPDSYETRKMDPETPKRSSSYVI